MQIRFPAVILMLIALLAALIYVLHLLGLATPANEVYVRFCALGAFIAGFVLLGWHKARRRRFSWSGIFKNNTMIVITLSVLLASLFVHVRAGLFATGFFAAAVFLHFLYSRKFYPPVSFFYFVILYALLLFLGTAGTPKGFHFPDRTLCFYILPLSLCFFRLPKHTLVRIAELFFKTATVFLAICILYWWYNFLHLEANLWEWITGKMSFSAEMTGWEEQIKKINYSPDITDISDFPAYFFVNSWSYYFHPSFISLVLFFGLVTGFYLYHKKNVISAITKFELILYAVLCLFVIALMESRIGFVGFIFIIAATGLYYLKLKTRYFKTGLAIYLLLGCISLYLLNDTVSGFIDDEIRNAYRRIAVTYIHDNLWWGGGSFQEQAALEQQAESMKNTLPNELFPLADHPIHYVHNQFFGDMVQFGIWGLIALLTMLFAIIYYAVKKRSYLLQMTMSIIFLFMMIEEPLYALVGIVRFFAFLVFFTAISEAGTVKKDKLIT
jgi:hypothetical protein